MTKHGGNPKPSRKTCYSKETVGYNLATGQRRQFRSMRRAALDLGLSIAAVQDFIGRRPFRGWLFFLLEEENTKKCQDSLRYWKENFDKDCRYIGEDAPMPARKTPTTQTRYRFVSMPARSSMLRQRRLRQNMPSLIARKWKKQKPRTYEKRYQT